MEPIDIYTLVLYRPDAIRVWEDSGVKEKLSWYLRVMRNEAPAKYRIVKRIEVDVNPYGISDLGELWKIHDKYSSVFRKIYREVRDGSLEYNVDKQPIPKHSLLDVKIAIAYKILESCRFCEWKCSVNRKENKAGSCRVTAETIVHTYFLHMGEESVLVPSGTIFYGGCNFHCVFCQNWDISQEHPTQGIRVDAPYLAKIQEELRKAGARNINHVGGDPTPNIHTILESLKYMDINVPQLWNSNMYLSLEGLKLIKDVIDIWLPDFKYGNNECGLRLSRVRNYFDIVTRNLKIIHDEGEEIIIRHLVLPNHIDCCTRKVLEYISKYLPRTLVNIMDQYRPEYIVARNPDKYRDIARRPSWKEIREAFDIAREYGLVKRVEDLCFKP